MGPLGAMLIILSMCATRIFLQALQPWRPTLSILSLAAVLSLASDSIVCRIPSMATMFYPVACRRSIHGMQHLSTCCCSIYGVWRIVLAITWVGYQQRSISPSPIVLRANSGCHPWHGEHGHLGIQWRENAPVDGSLVNSQSYGDPSAEVSHTPTLLGVSAEGFPIVPKSLRGWALPHHASLAARVGKRHPLAWSFITKFSI
ncbi:hypothetical protein C8F01DRAFT_1227290 [Mycena amicta]|nr:hypothetical protein C8F01DRAFT_1227290 [Mycena amicta]